MFVLFNHILVLLKDLWKILVEESMGSVVDALSMRSWACTIPRGGGMVRYDTFQLISSPATARSMRCAE